MGERYRKYRAFLWGVVSIGMIGIFILLWNHLKNQVPDELQVSSSQQMDWDEVFDNPLITYDSAVTVSQSGSYTVTCYLLDCIPLKTMKVTYVDYDTVYASGEPIGIYMETEGVLVIDSGEITDIDGNKQEPAKHIVESGDYILSVDGEKLDSKKELIQLVEENEGETMKLEVLRNKQIITLSLHPIQTEDGTYKLGIWVRDNIQGIGTMTCVTEDGAFMALGHGISDIDTGEQLKISSGNLYNTKILGIQKGAVGNPGELKGVIDYSEKEKIGDILVNSGIGISGTLYENQVQNMLGKQYQVGFKQEMECGSAQLICDVGDGVTYYDLEITKIDVNSKEENQNFEIKVTDQELLEKTGGIVQGMSGSPIIQNRKIVGAVTHVLVNDPTRGYGIFIENMLDAAG
ncbi:MAG: SpoIVB peptidase [Ruminococcus sp.]|nr:SpoIVB peptidase [Ruminococcus sp.]